MLGRGIDQILPNPGSAVLYEEYTKSARDYVALAERKNGPIPRPVSYEYVWGDALTDLERENLSARIVNLETSITTSDNPIPKGINYRMHPANLPVLSAGKIDCCALANNHVLDWGTRGLEETLHTLDSARIRHVGAGLNEDDASAAAQIPLSGGTRLLVFAFGLGSSGIPSSWSAIAAKPGVNLLPDFSEETVERIARKLQNVRKECDIAVASIHWGGNWGYDISSEQRTFAKALIDSAGFDVVHGHSSHHAKAMEIYRDRLILYGCGDFITDYEGIAGYEEFRGDLSMAYLPELSQSGALLGLRLLVYRLRKFRLERATAEDVHWLQQRLLRESAGSGVQLEAMDGNALRALGLSRST